MSLKQIVTAALVAFAGTAALAESPTIVEDNFVATKTRAQVQAEAAQARAAGEIFVSEVDLSTTRPQAAMSTLTRAQVQAELRNSPRVQIGELYPAA
jgi:hypothetical protein